MLARGRDLDKANTKLRLMMERQQGGLDWLQDHQCDFTIEKFGVMGFTRRREQGQDDGKCTRPADRRPIFIWGTKVPTVSSHKFLGVIIDQELRWKEQVNYALQKGTAWVTQYRRLAKPSRGLSAKHMRRFYIAVAIPKILYVADLFLVPEADLAKGTKGFISKLGRVQRQAGLHITGAMRSAPTDAVDTCTDLLPFHLLVKKLVCCAATRLAMLPQSHPLAKHTNKAAGRYVKRHRAPLHEVLHAFEI